MVESARGVKKYLIYMPTKMYWGVRTATKIQVYVPGGFSKYLSTIIKKKKKKDLKHCCIIICYFVE